MENEVVLGSGGLLAGLAALFLPKLLEVLGLKKPAPVTPTVPTVPKPTTGNAAIDKLLPLLPPKIAAVVVLLLSREEKQVYETAKLEAEVLILEVAEQIGKG